MRVQAGRQDVRGKKVTERNSTIERVRKHRAALRAAGLRPVQIWVPDTRRRGFAAECRRQSLSLRDYPIGRLDDGTLIAVNRALAVFSGFA